jgi:hypothetical protein
MKSDDENEANVFVAFFLLKSVGVVHALRLLTYEVPQRF